MHCVHTNVNDYGTRQFLQASAWLTSGIASPQHRQVMNCISKGSKNILTYNFIVTTFDCPGGSQGGGISARAFALARPDVVPTLWLTRQRNMELSR